MSSRWGRSCHEHLGNAGTGASVKDAVKAVLGQKATVVTSSSTNGLGSDEEERVRFWARPALDSPTLQQRLWHAWGAVQSPTGGHIILCVVTVMSVLSQSCCVVSASYCVQSSPCLVLSPSCLVLLSSRLVLISSCLVLLSSCLCVIIISCVTSSILSHLHCQGLKAYLGTCILEQQSCGSSCTPRVSGCFWVRRLPS